MSSDTALRVLLGLVLACLVVLVIQGCDQGAPAPELAPAAGAEPASAATEEPAPEPAPTGEKKPKKKKAKKKPAVVLKPLAPPPLPKPRQVKVDPQTEVEALSHALSPENPITIRVWAAEQLGVQGGEDAIPVLTRTLGDSNTEVVIAAIRALRDSGDPGARPAIEPLLKHPSSDVQKAARQALESE